MLFADDPLHDASDNKLLSRLRRRMRVKDQLHGHAFTMRQSGHWTGKLVRYATPLLLALIVTEIADLIFAVDLVPAVFI
ncbi:TerC family protein [Paracoccus beibuensis]|uniref:hypothetical protein n=1 Tax=Paracoccus beibuensis TaxID=547602 RepID=UPI00223F6007|nr:hypothetical protein [Paracoccus beibuensis]